MPKVEFISGDVKTVVDCRSGISVAEAAAAAGVALTAPCGGKGICGNCRVVVNGEVTPPSEAELAFIGENARFGIRLACMTYIAGDCAVAVQSLPSFTASPAKKRAKLSPVTGSKKCVAAAIDVGTTTVVIKLISLPDGKPAGETSFLNPQCNYGADVVTRLEYCLKGGAKTLSEAINRELGKRLEAFAVKPEFTVVTGNTVMLHLAAGLDPSGIANYPFTPETLFGEWIEDRFYVGCAGPYIGGDVIASALASGMTSRPVPAVLTDFGTNNETLLWDGFKLYACSSAAGPAFEGAHVSCGMPAFDGAITDVKIRNGEAAEIETVNGKPPRGFCGTGLVSAAAALYENGFIAPDGSVLAEFPDFGSVRLLPEDIAELQLAKSAVRSGIDTLLHHRGLKRVFSYRPAGSFGKRLKLDSAVKIGMIPEFFAEIAEDPVEAIDGAEMMALDESGFDLSKKIASETEVVSLADSSFFADSFISNLYFPYPAEE